MIFLLLFVSRCLMPLHAGQRVTPLTDLAKPTRIEVRADRLYVADGAKVHMYDLNDLSRCKTFGREGEGPGEIKGLIYYMETTPDGLIVNSEGRISWFGVDGGFIRQKTESSLGINFKTFGDGFVGMKLQRGDRAIFFSIGLFDGELKKTAELHRYRHPFFGRGRPINAVDVRISSYHIEGNRIYVDIEDGVIAVFDHTGKRIRTFQPSIQPVPVEDRHRERYLRFWKLDLKAEYEAFKNRLFFPDHFPPIRDFLMDGGKIYLITHREKGEENELIILDTGGKELRRGWIPVGEVNPVLPHLFSLYTIRGGTLYKLVDNEIDETWELHTVPLN
jgi:hypothetical protein